MTEYIVYRNGWNDANQKPDHGLPYRMPVARVQADSADEACRLAASTVTLEGNQHLSAEPAAPVDASVNNLDLKAEAIERAGNA